MATFLTTSKMSPALVARIEASVRGRRHSRGRPSVAPSFVALFRLGAVTTIVAAIAALALARHASTLRVAASRRSLLDAAEREIALVTTDDRATVARAEAWLLRSSGSYEGDFVASELQKPGALGALLSRPVVYVRGPVAAFKSAAGIKQAAAESLKDAFVLCLLDPPESRVEKAVLAKVRAAYSGVAVGEPLTPNVRRLYEAEAGLPLLSPAWAERVVSATDEDELAALRKQRDGAKLKTAEQALAARLLVFAMDEPGESRGLSELDGERPHPIRVGIVDLRAEKVLLRLEKVVDPAWISLPKRERYASGLDACALAFDVRSAATPSP